MGGRARSGGARSVARLNLDSRIETRDFMKDSDGSALVAGGGVGPARGRRALGRGAAPALAEVPRVAGDGTVAIRGPSAGELGRTTHDGPVGRVTEPTRKERMPMTFDEKGLHYYSWNPKTSTDAMRGVKPGVKDVAGVAKLYGQGTSG